MVEGSISVLALLTGATRCVVFALLQVPIPAPPEPPGVLGIVGIVVGYRLVEAAGWSVDLFGAFGLSPGPPVPRQSSGRRWSESYRLPSLGRARSSSADDEPEPWWVIA